jgi:hypothetical protein
MTTGGPPDGEQGLTDMCFWAQILQDARRTIYCHPDDAAVLQQAVQDQGIAHLYTVTSSPIPASGQMYLLDHQALEATQRQALRRWRPTS